MNKKFHLICVMFVLLLFASCGEDKPESQGQDGGAGKIYRSPEGMIVESLKVEKDDIADILGITIWKFKLIIAEPELLHKFCLELQSPEKDPEIVFAPAASSFLSSERIITVALYPLADNAEDEDKLGIFIGMSTNTGTNSGSWRSVINNPGTGFKYPISLPTPDLQDNGEYILMAYSNSGRYPDPDNSQLVFRVSVAEE